MSTNDMDQAMLDFVQLCSRYNFNAVVELRQKTRELRWRAFLKSRSNDLLVGAHQYERFLTDVFNRFPSADELKHASEELIGKRTHVAHAAKEQLRERQGYRCRHCGRMLTSSANEHVDHIRPVAFGGDTTVDNLRIICEPCNLAKSDLLDWTLGRLFDRVWDQSPSSFVRYAVLARDESRCTTKSCKRTWRDDELRVTRAIPERRGGRPVFDNLVTVCLSHYNLRHINSEIYYDIMLD